MPRSPRALVVAIFLGSRILVLASAHAGALLMTPEKHREWDWDPAKSDLFRGPAPPALLAPLVRWDANFYLLIAEYGYPAGHSEAKPNYVANFFPLYPLVVRAVHRVGVDLFWAAIAVSNAACLVAALLVYEIGRRRASGAAGVQSAALLLLAPGSHFLSLPYPEGLFAVLLAGALLAIFANRPWVAALLGALASATRSAGVVVFVALLYEAWVRRRDAGAALRVAAAAICSLGGAAAFAVFCSRAYGDPLLFVHTQALFGRTLSVVGPIKALLRFDVDPDYYLVTAACVVAVVVMWRTIRGVESVVAAFLLALPLFTGTMKAMIRYQTVNLGLVAGIPRVAPRAMRVVLIGCGILLVVETALFGMGIGHN